MGTFLVPDVAGEGPAAMVEAARAAAAGMGSFELVTRTAVEIAGVWTVTWLITSIIRSLCSRAGKVSHPNLNSKSHDLIAHCSALSAFAVQTCDPLHHVGRSMVVLSSACCNRQVTNILWRLPCRSLKRVSWRALQKLK